MDSIGLKNLRSLSDTGFVELKPITLLLGQNSSGKSTFLRTFPLIRQSLESRTTGPILWYGQYVDFGNFQDSLFIDAEDPEITFEFGFELPKAIHNSFQNRYDYRFFVDETSLDKVLLGLTITSDARQEGSVHKKTLLQTYGHDVVITYDADGRIVTLSVNGRDFSSSVNEMRISPRGLVPRILDSKYLFSESVPTVVSRRESRVLELLIGEIKKYMHKKTSPETIQKFALGLGIDNTSGMLDKFRNARNATETWRERVSSWTADTPDFLMMRDLVIANAVPRILDICDDYLCDFFKISKYLAPVRAMAERYYRIQNLAVNEIDLGVFQMS